MNTTFGFDPSLDGVWILLAGQPAPRIDVNLARAQAAQWLATGPAVNQLAGDANRLVAQVRQSASGPVGEALSERLRKITSVAPKLVDAAGRQYQSEMDVALNVDAANKGMFIEIIMFLNELTWAAASPFTAPLIPGFLAAARAAAHAILMRMHVAVRVAAQLTAGAGSEALEETLQALAAQLWQMAESFRTGFDNQDLGFAAIGGALAGAMMAGQKAGLEGFREGLGRNPLAHGIFEGNAEVGTGAAMIPITGSGKFEDLWHGAVNGAFTGTVPSAVEDFMDDRFGADDLGVDTAGLETLGHGTGPAAGVTAGVVGGAGAVPTSGAGTNSAPRGSGPGGSGGSPGGAETQGAGAGPASSVAGAAGPAADVNPGGPGSPVPGPVPSGAPPIGVTDVPPGPVLTPEPAPGNGSGPAAVPPATLGGVPSPPQVPAVPDGGLPQVPTAADGGLPQVPAAADNGPSAPQPAGSGEGPPAVVPAGPVAGPETAPPTVGGADQSQQPAPRPADGTGPLPAPPAPPGPAAAQPAGVLAPPPLLPANSPPIGAPGGPPAGVSAGVSVNTPHTPASAAPPGQGLPGLDAPVAPLAAARPPAGTVPTEAPTAATLPAAATDRTPVGGLPPRATAGPVSPSGSGPADGRPSTVGGDPGPAPATVDPGVAAEFAAATDRTRRVDAALAPLFADPLTPTAPLVGLIDAYSARGTYRVNAAVLDAVGNTVRGRPAAATEALDAHRAHLTPADRARWIRRIDELRIAHPQHSAALTALQKQVATC